MVSEKDNSQSWVRISHGSNKFVVDSNYNNTEVPADPHIEQASQSSVRVVAARSKAKAKPQKREKLLNYRASFQRMKESGLTLSHQNPLSSYEVSEESNPFLCDIINSTERRRWSSSFLEIKNFIFEIISH